MWTTISGLRRDARILEDFVAVVAPVGLDLLESPPYAQALKQWLTRAARDDAFRLYLFPAGRLSGGRRDVAELLEVVQGDLVDERRTSDEVDDALVRFLDEYSDIRDAVLYQRALRVAVRAVAIASLGLVAVALASTLGAVVIALGRAFGQDWPLPTPAVVSVMVGAGTMTILLALLSYPPTPRLSLLAANLAVVASMVLPLSAVGWVLGALFGLIGAYGRRRSAELEPLDFALDGAEPVGSHASALGWAVFRMISGPITPTPKRVFVSYRRQSWAADVAIPLREALAAENVECFVDSRDIAIGTAWRQVLRDGVRRSTYVLLFEPDQEGGDPSMWQKMELRLAISLWRRIRRPTIVIVVSGSATAPDDLRRGQRLGARLAVPDCHVVAIGPNDIGPFAHAIAASSGNSPGARMPRGLDLLTFGISSATHASFMIAGLLGNLCLFMCPVYGLVAVLGRVPPGFRGPLGVLSWLGAGFGARAVLHSRYEAALAMVREYGKTTTFLTILAFLTGVLLVAAASVAAVVAWAFAALLLGFMALDDVVMLGRKNFKFPLRSTPDRI